MSSQDADAIIASIRHLLTTTSQALIEAAEAGLKAVERAAEAGVDPVVLAGVRRSLLAVLEAASFDDLIGQRLSQLQALDAPPPVPDEARLLNGPAAPGHEVDQAAIDAWFAAAAPEAD